LAPSAAGDSAERTQETSPPAKLASPGYREIAVTPIRNTIAARMVQSAQTTATVTLSTTVDVTNLVNLRQQFKEVAAADLAPAVGVTDIVVKLTACALEKHPLLNARWSGDKILISSSIHIGIAVDTAAGLMVPVMHDVPRQTLRQLAARSRDLIDRARRGLLSAVEMQGGTFTVTNLGPLGIEMFTPLINLPESAILGLGRIQKQVVVDDKQFVARDRMMLSLSVDHRIVDGAPAARFLQHLGRLIENPSPWLLP
jgi:pyruvate dehydrogenase E2 component (dihydrolipoamide acetyltransferase)